MASPRSAPLLSCSPPCSLSCFTLSSSYATSRNTLRRNTIESRCRGLVNSRSVAFESSLRPSDDFPTTSATTLVYAASKERSAAGATSCEAQTRSRYEDVTSRHASRSARHLTFRSSRLPTYPGCTALSLSLSLSLSVRDKRDEKLRCTEKHSARATDYASSSPVVFLSVSLTSYLCYFRQISPLRKNS